MVNWCLNLSVALPFVLFVCYFYWNKNDIWWWNHSTTEFIYGHLKKHLIAIIIHFEAEEVDEEDNHFSEDEILSWKENFVTEGACMVQTGATMQWRHHLIAPMVLE